MFERQFCLDPQSCSGYIAPMERILEELISDFHERDLPALTRRQARLPWLSGKIDSVIGMRRSGKTWYLFQIISDLLTHGMEKERILYLNLEDERLLPITAADLHWIPDVYFRQYPQFREKECCFFFDEIQNIPGWERFIRRLLDTENAHICLTGSSAKLLSREIATSLRGRSISTEIFPFSFFESLDHAGIDVEPKKRPGAKRRSMLENQLRAYLQEGGFPEVQKVSDEYRLRILQDYLNVVILRDLVERHQVSNIVPLRYMIRRMLNSTASLLSINKLYHEMKSQGIRCGKNTLHEYLDYLTDAYLFFQVQLYAHSERARAVNPKKIYAIDTGLVRACSHRVSTEWGHLLENFVFLELRRKYDRISYYRTEKGHEVDFLITTPHGEPLLIQVAAEIREPATRKRELQAITEAMIELRVERSLIVTMSDEERLETPAGQVDIYPAWYWAISETEHITGS